jgi:hypothetical protein
MLKRFPLSMLTYLVLLVIELDTEIWSDHGQIHFTRCG